VHIKTDCNGVRIDLHHSVAEVPNASEFERHTHKMFELIYVVRGNGRYVVEGAEYPLLPGTVLLLRPYEYHYVCPEESSPYERYVIHFDEGIAFENESTLACFRDDRFGAGVYFPKESLDGAVLHAFESLDVMHRFTLDEITLLPAGKVMMRSVVTQILLLLGAARPAEPVAPRKDLLFGVIGYINGHLNENLTLDELSRRFFVSKYHLCRAFRQHTGTTFLSYLTTKRIAAAQQMIKEGVPVTEIAYRVGFRDYSSFYRAFRKQTGSAPAWERRE
jgi:AraC-like DNA-binding protein